METAALRVGGAPSGELLTRLKLQGVSGRAAARNGRNLGTDRSPSGGLRLGVVEEKVRGIQGT